MYLIPKVSLCIMLINGDVQYEIYTIYIYHTQSVTVYDVDNSWNVIYDILTAYISHTQSVTVYHVDKSGYII